MAEATRPVVTGGIGWGATLNSFLSPHILLCQENLSTVFLNI